MLHKLNLLGHKNGFINGKIESDNPWIPDFIDPNNARKPLSSSVAEWSKRIFQCAKSRVRSPGTRGNFFSENGVRAVASRILISKPPNRFGNKTNCGYQKNFLRHPDV